LSRSSAFVGVRVAWPWLDRNRRFSALKTAAFAIVCAPALWLAYEVEAGHFGRLALGGMTYWSGLWATVLLMLALAITPLAALLRWSQLIVVRRMIGVSAALYAVAHVLIYFALRLWDFAVIFEEVISRLSLLVACVATAGLITLAATSRDSVIRRMGARGWKSLHGWVYGVAGLALAHYVLSPSVYPDQYLLSGAFLWLMAWRWLNARGRGTDRKALLLLAMAVSLFTAFFEAGWIWIYHGFDPVQTLHYNLTLDLGLSPAWKLLLLGVVLALAAGWRRPSRAAA
jgi:sulfoxide reductase heme-binding subunit YedZ